VSEADRRDGRASRALLGLLALSLFVGAIGLTWVFLRGGLRGGESVAAVFSSPGVGQQLPVGGDVKVRGVLVGSIADIHLDDDGNAIVELRLENSADFPASTEAEIRSKTIFGQKWVELIPPSETAGETLATTAVIPDDRTQEPLELERALQLGHNLLSEIPLGDLAEVFESLARGFAGQKRNARRAIDRGLVALRSVNASEGDLNRALTQLREFSDWLDDNDEAVVSLMESVDAANRALVGAAPEFRANLSSVPAFLDQFAAFQERIEGDLGSLVENGATVAELVANRTDSLVDLVVQLEAFTTIWNSMLTAPCSGLFESNLTCWQVYLMPGIDSRGLYDNGEGPDQNEPGDPNFGSLPATVDFTFEEFSAALSDRVGTTVDAELAGLLYGLALELISGTPEVLP
jgi:virulence factor Mce-like protein